MKEFFLTGDSPFFSPLQMKGLSWLPSVWHEEYGLGLTDISRLWIEYPFRLIVKLLSLCGFSWFYIEKMLWSICFLLAFIGIYRLLRYFGIPKLFSCIGGFFYLCNTYAFLLIGGGQMGVFFGYASIPCIISAIQKGYAGAIKERISCGIIISLSIMADLRLAVLGVLAGFFLLCLSSRCRGGMGIVKKTVLLLGTVAFIVIPMHAFWIIPLVLFPNIHLGNDAYTGAGMAKFLSFADFSHALSFLHPNWPQNLFGKTYFLQPEFLVLPILVFSSLLFVTTRKQQNNSGKSIKYQVSSIKYENKYVIPNTLYFIQIFALLALIGAFFAKGANPPFREIYLWCMNYIPGFILFRDPTKFYAIIGCAYAFLLASTGAFVVSRARTRNPWISIGVGGGITFLCIIFVRDIFLGNIIRFIPMSEEYQLLESMFIKEQHFFRTLWIPAVETFSPMGNDIPRVIPEMIFRESSPSAIIRIFRDPTIGEKISRMGIQYVVVIPDERKTQYLTDYVFDPDIKNEYIQAIEQNPSFERKGEFSHLSVFRNKALSEPLLTIDDVRLSYDHPANGTYRIKLNGSGEKLRFLFQFDPYWQVSDGIIVRRPQKDGDGFMVFDVQGMSNALTLHYLPEQVSRTAAPVSLVFFVFVCIVSLIYHRKKRA